MASQVAEHRDLVASVRDQARDILDSSEPPRADDSMDSQWRTMARQLADKTRQLQQAIDASKPQVKRGRELIETLKKVVYYDLFNIQYVELVFW